VNRKSASIEKQKREKQATASPGSDVKPLPAPLNLRPPAALRWAGAGLLVSAAALRLFNLTLKPLHHDEGVNGLFLVSLARNGYYHYDPANYHGPTLYYFAWFIARVIKFFLGGDGLSTFGIRLVTALFGIGIVWLLLSLRRQLGHFGSVAAAALAAVSCGFVFFSRYFIHEILFVFFSLAVVMVVLRFRQNSDPRDLMLAAVFAALLGATKETWAITAAVWLIALPCTNLYLRLRRRPAWQTGAQVKATLGPTQKVAGSTQKQEETNKQLYLAVAVLFVFVWVLFYSSFFTNFRGVVDSVRTFGYWFKTSESAHEYGPFKYLEWLWQEEAPVLLLGAMGMSAAFWQARNRFAVFTAFWSLGILAAYSLVHYKTPWNALNIILPLIIMAGYGLEQLYQTQTTQSRTTKRWLTDLIKVVAVLLLATGVGVSLYQAVDLSFVHYDDDSRAYVYAHTRRDFLGLVNEIDSIAKANPAGKNIGIVVMSPEHWPLPWYLRNYTHVGYWGKVIDTSEPILVVHENQVEEVERRLGYSYRRLSSHELRPGNELFLYVKR
jgi:uncharacterized protein (TIGR03663 family)